MALGWISVSTTTNAKPSTYSQTTHSTESTIYAESNNRHTPTSNTIAPTHKKRSYPLLSALNTVSLPKPPIKMCFTSKDDEPTPPPRRSQYTDYDRYLHDRDWYERQKEAYLKKQRKKSRRRGNYAGVYAAGGFAAAGCGGGGGGGC